MPYEANVGKFIIDNLNQRGCYIVSVRHGIYNCTDWEVLSNFFQSTVDGMPNSGTPVQLNADDVANNPNFSIVLAPAGALSGFEDPLIPAGLTNGVNDTYTMPWGYEPTSIMIFEDGILLNSSDPLEIVKLSSTTFRVLPAPETGSQLIVLAKKL